MVLFIGHVLDKRDLDSLTRYTYSSGTPTALDVFLDRYWWSRVAVYVPRWVAPNALTVMGLVCTLAATWCVFVFNNTFTEEIPRAVLLLISLLMFTFQTLDAIDGKHARRIGACSPLGQLLDHGCDSFSAMWVGWIIWGVTSFGCGRAAYSMLAVLQVQLFVYTLWEGYMGNYKTNTAGLGGIRIGVTEGQLVVVLLALVGGVWGGGVFTSPVLSIIPKPLSGVKPLLVYLPYVDETLTISLALWTLIFFNIIKMSLTDMHTCVTTLKSSKQRNEAICQFTVIITHVIVQYHFFTSVWAQSHRALTCVAITSFNSIYIIRLQLFAVCKKKIAIVQWPIIPLYIGTMTMSLLKESNYGRAAPWLMTLWSSVYLTHLVVTVINDLTTHLNISFFYVDQKRKR